MYHLDILSIIFNIVSIVDFFNKYHDMYPIIYVTVAYFYFTVVYSNLFKIIFFHQQ